jgi:single-strand DNA-binding protein
MIGCKTIIIGRLTKDITLKSTQNGVMIANGSIAYNLYEGKTRGETSHFIDFFAFSGMAETMSTYLSKGRLVALEGPLVFRQWENKDGKKFSKHELKVDDIQFLEKSNKPDNVQNQATAEDSTGNAINQSMGSSENPPDSMMENPFENNIPMGVMSDDDISF